MKSVHAPLVVAALVALAFAGVAGVVSHYILYVLTAAACLAIIAISFDVLVGYTGYLSLAHGTFYGVGAYALGNLTTRLGWSFWLALPASGLIAAAGGSLVAALAFRTRGLYFAVLTLGIGLVGFQLFVMLDDLTGGVVGFVGIPRPPQLPGLSIDPLRYNLILTVALAWITFAASFCFVRSRIGMACLAIREDDMLARALGIKINIARLAAFTFSAFFAGVAGALFASTSNFAGPDSFAVMSIGFQLVVVVVVGGMGTLWGPALGALLITALPELLRGANSLSLLVYGILLLLVISFAPRGAAGLIKTLLTKMRRKPGSRAFSQRTRI